jgi:hypothetical protein
MSVSARLRGMQCIALAMLCAFMSLFALPAAAVAPDSMDFGGMYGSGGPLPGRGFTNPITHAQFCPGGYKAYKALGTPSVDWPLYWCGRPHLKGRTADYDFGGMYSYTSQNNRGVVPWKGQYAYVNPFTFTDSCPPGYAAARVFGTDKLDNLLFFCYRPHAETSPAMDFAGLSGNGTTPYPNPLTGKYGTCPSGYNRYSTYGTPYVDYNLFYCGAPGHAAHPAAGAGSLGLGEPIVGNTQTYHYDLQEQIDGIISLHPRVLRMWMTNYRMFSGISGYARPTPDADGMALYHKAVDALTNAGITLIGMDSSFPPWLTGISGKCAWRLPARNLSWGSPYSDFLNRWEATWAASAREFPDITQWEIGNETNPPNGTIPPRIDQIAGDPCRSTKFTAHDRLLINLDLMYYGNRGVKSANPEAVVYMPSISPHDADGNLDGTLASIADFLEQIYTAIAAGEGPSTNPRDYFDGANWHPYVFGDREHPKDATHDTWVEANNRPYRVLQAHGDGGIPVILSEVGYEDTTHEPAETIMDHSIDLAERDLPWLTYLIWFRAYPTKPGEPTTDCDAQCRSWRASRYALLLGPPFKRTIPAGVFCKYTGCDNLPYKRF